jgi:hypothetical protein
MKYSIEGEIDFYAELNSLSNDVNIVKDACNNDDSNESDDNNICNANNANNANNAINENYDTNICLITGDKLTDHYVELKCGHKFNYIPLYNDIKNHKLKFNSLESFADGHLTMNQIRCPYCRSKQDKLLPYIENSGCSKIIGVNYLSDSSKCGYDLTYPCYVTTHLTSINYGVNTYGDYNFYCSKHKKEMIKFYTKKELKESKLKAKEEAKAAKLKAKEEEKAAKLKAKEEEKAAKLKAKEEAKAAKLKAKEEEKAAKLKAKQEAKLFKINNSK